MQGWTLHEHIMPYVIDAGLYGIAYLGTLTIDHALVTLLIQL